MSDIRFDGKTVVVTGAGGGLGKAYCLLFGSRGANVVVNDLGGALKGDGGGSTTAADQVVAEVKKLGGNAVADYNSVEQGDKIIDTAINAFGRIDILINNAGILRDVSFKNMKDQDWDLIFTVHVTGAYKCARAAWPHFRKQKFGRVINTASAAGLFGNFGQTNYSAAKLALVGFTETLAKEGAKYNIFANIIAPIAASRMTETILPPEILAQLKPEFITPLVAVLASEQSKENGSIFEVGGGHMAKLRWERSKGLTCKPDDSYGPGSILKGWSKVVDYSDPQYASGPADFVSLLEEALELKGNESDPIEGIKGKVAIVTGGGAGLGRAYCLLFSKLGAKVVVNDLVNPDDVVNEIRKSGGEAVGAKFNVEEGEAIVKTAIDAFGEVHILVNNAGILRDKAFNNMTDDLWFAVMNTHMRGTFKCSKAVWPHFLKQKYGRIVNTTSTSGIYGNFGQANYAAAKCGILGFSRALALEGEKYNIFVNTIAPNAGTAMTRTVMPEEMVQAFKPHYVAPMVALLCSDSAPEPTGGLYEIGSGWQGQTRWQRSGGAAFPIDVELKPEHIAAQWEKLVNFEDGRSDNPFSSQEGLQSIMANSQNKSGGQSESSSSSDSADDEENVDYNAAIAKAKDAKAPGSEFVYETRDVILYNLGLGCGRTELPFVYEGDDDFQVLPTYGVIPPFSAVPSFDMSAIIPNFNPMMLLHGEQYLEIRKWPIPTESTLVSYPQLVDVVDKGKAAVVFTGSVIKEKATGDDVFYSESTAFIRGAGGFGGPKQPQDRGKATKSYAPPKRAADATIEEKTSEDQAAIYRLSGDFNPLHIDPDFSAVGGFEVPILHGLCFFGIACKHVLKQYGRYSDVKVRFAGVVIPGQTLKTEMWKEGRIVVFQTTVVETGKLCIAGAGATLLEEGKSKL